MNKFVTLILLFAFMPASTNSCSPLRLYGTQNIWCNSNWVSAYKVHNYEFYFSTTGAKMVKLYGKHIEVFKGAKLADEIIAEAISQPGLGSCANVASSIYGYDDKIALQLNETYLLCGQNAHGKPYLEQYALFYPNITTAFPNWQKDVPESLKKILRKKSFKCPGSN